MTIVLFDIDGTLVSVRGAGRRALQLALQDVTGVAGALEGIRLAGSTDPVILEAAFARHVGRDPEGAEELARVMAAYLERLPHEVAALGEQLHVFPGARALVEALRATGRHLVGLATGNVEPGAYIKLRSAGLAEHFSFGGFGSDAAHRAELVRRGIERGQWGCWRAARTPRRSPGRNPT